MLFYGNPEKTDFNSIGFKLLWEKEKNININELKKYMIKKPKLKKRIVATVPDATKYYEWIYYTIYLLIYHYFLTEMFYKIYEFQLKLIYTISTQICIWNIL